MARSIEQQTAKLPSDLLDVSRIATGKIRLAEADVDVNQVVGARSVRLSSSSRRSRLACRSICAPSRAESEAMRLAFARSW